MENKDAGNQVGKASSSSRKKQVSILLVILLIIGGVTIWYWYVNLREFVSTDDAYIDANRVSISSTLLEHINKLTVDEGAEVQAGQVLVQLDDADLRAQETQAKAALEAEERNVSLAKINLERARDDYQRAENLIKGGNIAKQQYDHARNAFEAAEAQYNIAVAQVEVAKSQLGVIQTKLLNVIITSPINGVVAKKWALPGDVVQPGQPIFTVYDMAHIWITANLEETKLTSINLNDPVEIFIDAYPGKLFRGKVAQLGVNTASQFSLIPPNNASGNFTKVTQRVPIKISIDDLNNTGTALLLPGMSAVIKIHVRPEGSVSEGKVK